MYSIFLQRVEAKDKKQKRASREKERTLTLGTESESSESSDESEKSRKCVIFPNHNHKCGSVGTLKPPEGQCPVSQEWHVQTGESREHLDGVILILPLAAAFAGRR